MAALIRAIAATSLMLAVPMPVFAENVRAVSPPVFHASPTVERWRRFIAEASRRFGIPQAWIAAVMQAESAGLTHLDGRPITSHAGAMGLMQLMPGTWAAMRRQHGLGPDPHDPRDNILAGTAYLRVMYDRFGYPGLFAAYNAGPGRYAEHLRTGRPLPAETRRYIAQLARVPAAPAMPLATVSEPGLFFPLGRRPASGPSPHTDSPPESSPSDRLFVPLAAPTGNE